MFLLFTIRRRTLQQSFPTSTKPCRNSSGQSAISSIPPGGGRQIRNSLFESRKHCQARTNSTSVLRRQRSCYSIRTSERFCPCLDPPPNRTWKVNLVCRSGVRSQPQRLDHRIMQRGPHFGDLHIFACRIHAIRQQHNKQLPVGVDVNRSPCKSCVSE